MAAAAPKLRGAARTANRSGNLHRAQRQSALERAGEAWGEEPEVLSGGGEGPESEGGRSAELRRQQVSARSGPDQDEALKQAALSSQEGMATLDKRTGEIKEGIGGASSEEAAKQNRERRDLSKSSREAAQQAKALRTGANSGAQLAAQQNKERRNMSAGSDEAARQNKMRRKAGIANLEGKRDPTGTGKHGDVTPDLNGRSETGTKRELDAARREALQAKAEKFKENVAKARDGGNSKLKRLKAGAGAAKDAGALVKGMAKEMQVFAGVWWLRYNWAILFPSWLHSIYAIDLTFIIGFMKKFIGFFFPIEIPEMGEEWLYNPAASAMGKGKKKSGKAKVLIIKVFEALAIIFFTTLVLLLDTMIIAVIVLVIVAFLKLGPIGALLASLFGFN